uniref:Uncharacterized protein n=1 Tax=viral metagenome TaxID=1070528 RepID=A0A6C0HNJ6_9ZZZZ
MTTMIINRPTNPTNPTNSNNPDKLFDVCQNFIGLHTCKITEAYNYAMEMSQYSELNQKHGSSFICENGELVVGYNHYEVYKRRPCVSIHAEEDAINNFILIHQLRGYSDRNIRKRLKKSILLTVRSKNGCPGLSAPCKNCLILIKYYGIKQIIYSIDANHKILLQKTKNLNSSRPSSGQRWLVHTPWIDTR